MVNATSPACTRPSHATRAACTTTSCGRTCTRHAQHELRDARRMHCAPAMPWDAAPSTGTLASHASAAALRTQRARLWPRACHALRYNEQQAVHAIRASTGSHPHSDELLKRCLATVLAPTQPQGLMMKCPRHNPSGCGPMKAVPWGAGPGPACPPPSRKQRRQSCSASAGGGLRPTLVVARLSPRTATTTC